MKICSLCHTENEEDAIYCKKCAHPFYEDSNNNSTKNKDKQKVKKQTKVKTKTKYKTKVQKQKVPKERQKSGCFSIRSHPAFFYNRTFVRFLRDQFHSTLQIRKFMESIP